MSPDPLPDNNRVERKALGRTDWKTTVVEAAVPATRGFQRFPMQYKY